MKTISSYFIFIIVISVTFSIQLYAQYAGGDGTSGDPYQIATAAQLDNVRDNLDAHFILTADIDLDVSPYNTGSGWDPIETFTGSFDGMEYTISGLYINRGSESEIGFFGSTDEGAVIKNIGLLDVDITCNSNCGGLVGRILDTEIDNSFVTGSVTGSSQEVGGFLGFMGTAGQIDNSFSRVSVTGDTFVGGFGGITSSGGTITNSYTTGSVSGNSAVGGFSGTNFATISNSFWNTETAGQSGGTGTGVGSNLTGKTTAEMKTKSTFTNAGWDFFSVWAIDSLLNDGYPGLLWQSGYTAPIAGTPIDTTNAVTNIESTSATFNGIVDSNNDTTTVRFIYGTTSGMYTDSINATQSPLFPDGVGGSDSVSVHVTGLTASQTYYIRVAAENSAGYARGDEVSFTTLGSDPPEATTGTVSPILWVSATASGTVDPNEFSTTVRFLLGTTSGVYTDSVQAKQSPVTGENAVSVSAELSGLSENTTYYVRVAAENSVGYVRGDETSFTTRNQPVLASNPGSALSLVASSNQYVGVSANTSLDLTDGTIESWVKPDWTPGSLSANPAIVANRSSGATRYSIHINNNMNSVDLWNGSAVGSISYTFSQGSWYHLVWVTEGSTSSLYINGNLIGTTTEVFSSSTGLPFSIGSNPSNESFEGQIDEVRVWNIPRTAQQIRENMHKTLVGTENGLVSYWQFNEGSGTATADSISLNSGTLQNGATWQTSTIPVGGGTSSSVSGFSNGTATMGAVSLTTTDAFDASVDITATQVDLSPNLLTEESVVLSDRYWVINTFGTPGTFSTDLSFTVPSGLTGAGTAPASDFTLYRRSSTSEGSWAVAVDGASSISDTTVTFAGITTFSQFMIGIDSLEQQITGNEGWRMLSVPVAGVSYGEFLDTLWTQGFTGADTENGSSNVYTWDEANRQFQSISNAADIPGVGTGILVYVYDDQDFDGTPDGFPKTLLVDSIQNSGSISPTLSYTAGVSDSVGWNLVGNPYGSTIDWSASTGWTQTNIDGSFYVWNASAGEYQSHNGSSGTLANSLIAPWQGFWVKATATDPALSLTDDVRSSGGTLLKKQSTPEIRFTLQETVDSLNTQSSQAMLMLHEQASTKKDRLDAYKLQPLNNEYLSLFTQLEDGTALDINALPKELKEVVSIDIDYQLSGAEKELRSGYLEWDIIDFPSDWKLELIENQTGKTIDLNTKTSYEFEIDAIGKAQSTNEVHILGSPVHGVLSPEIIKAKKEKSRTESRFTLTIIPGSAVSNEPEVAELPTKVELGQNYPNPFNPATTIHFGLPEAGEVRLEVYNLLGKKVATLVNERRASGTHTIRFDAQHLASGVYIYRLQTAGKTITKKLTLIK